MVIKRLALVVATIAATSMLSACSTNSTYTGGAVTVLEDQGYYAAIATSSSEGADALTPAWVVLDANSCWSITPSDGDDAIPVVWPAGTKIVGGTTLFTSDQSLSPDEKVTLAGGFVRAGDEYGSSPCIRKTDDALVAWRVSPDA
jgi:hypothetical protein